MNDPAEAPLPPSLRLLQRLVLALLVVMIAGVATVAATLVIRLTPDPPRLPEPLRLPPGAQAQAVTVGPDWVLVVTTDGRALVLDRATGRLRQEIGIETAPR
jgi:hypothetical protein